VRCDTVAIAMADLEVRRFVDLAAAILALPPSCGPARLVAIDGPGGAGKTTFAARLAVSFDGAPVVQVVHTDDFASWENQFGWAPRLRAQVIEPLKRGEPGRHQRYDWVERRLAEWHDVPVADVVIIEGVGAAQLAFADALAMAVWVETAPDVRLARGIARDGEQLRGFWEQWIVGERAHFATDQTRSRADLVVAGDPTVRHHAESEYLAIG
jgi:uridine kinase